MRPAPLFETGDKRVPIKDVLNVKKGLWPGYPQKPKPKSSEWRRKMSNKKRGRVPWNKGRALSKEHRENNRKGQEGADWHRPHIEMVLTGSCEGSPDCGREKRGVGCADSWYVCPWFVFESLAFYYCRSPAQPIALTPIKD